MSVCLSVWLAVCPFLRLLPGLFLCPTVCLYLRVLCFRCEVLKERHSTAKKLRKYYLHCLKQLLDEDRIALENNTSPSSTEDKLSRMAEALRTLSPDKELSGKILCVLLTCCYNLFAVSVANFSMSWKINLCFLIYALLQRL